MATKARAPFDLSAHLSGSASSKPTPAGRIAAPPDLLQTSAVARRQILMTFSSRDFSSGACGKLKYVFLREMDHLDSSVCALMAPSGGIL